MSGFARNYEDGDPRVGRLARQVQRLAADLSAEKKPTRKKPEASAPAQSVEPPLIVVASSGSFAIDVGSGLVVDGQSKLSVNAAEAVVDSTAVAVAGIVSDFNDLLASLRAAGLLKE